jgi:hypothetical protein
MIGNNSKYLALRKVRKWGRRKREMEKEHWKNTRQMDRSCNMHGTDEKCIGNSGKRKPAKYKGELGIDWTGFIWLSIETTGPIKDCKFLN